MSAVGCGGMLPDRRQNGSRCGCTPDPSDHSDCRGAININSGRRNSAERGLEAIARNNRLCQLAVSVTQFHPIQSCRDNWLTRFASPFIWIVSPVWVAITMASP